LSHAKTGREYRSGARLPASGKVFATRTSAAAARAHLDGINDLCRAPTSPRPKPQVESAKLG